MKKFFRIGLALAMCSLTIAGSVSAYDLSEANNKVTDLKFVEMVRSGPEYVDTRYFNVVVPGGKAQRYFYSEVIGDVYYSGYLEMREVGYNGTLYSGYLDGYRKGSVMADPKEEK